MRPLDINNHIKSHGIILNNKQILLTKPLFVFKKVYVRQRIGKREAAIANLVIPTGAIVNGCKGGGNGKKCRASQAYCHSIALIRAGNQQEKFAHSGYHSIFQYNSGIMNGLDDSHFNNMVLDAEKYESNIKLIGSLMKAKCQPDRFDYKTEVCSYGVHFFVELQSALDY